MALNRIVPTLFQDMNRAFSMLEEPLFDAARRGFPSRFKWQPAVDVSESDKAYHIDAEVPGMRKEDLDIEFTDGNTLVLKGKVERSVEARPNATVEEAKSESTDVAATPEGESQVVADTQQRTWWTSERVSGSFQRSFAFPSRIDPESVKATYKDGILSIEIPKAARSVSKVTIQ